MPGRERFTCVKENERFWSGRVAGRVARTTSRRRNGSDAPEAGDDAYATNVGGGPDPPGLPGTPGDVGPPGVAVTPFHPAVFVRSDCDADDDATPDCLTSAS